MRTIKFRGKRVDNGEWVAGKYYTSKYANKNDSVRHYISYGDHWGNYEVTPETVGQFTGLTDKNGKEIYEDSDLLLMKFTIQVNSFKECSYIERKEDGSSIYKKIIQLPSVLTIRNPTTGYEFYNKKYNVYTPLWVKFDSDISHLEVIGNIHDNPELCD